MIRHRLGDDFILITQHDHAQLSGRLAERVGNALFSAPTPFQETVDGIALHDCGWPLHDERPTLNPQGQPLHVLESPMSVAIPVWSESVRLASQHNALDQLLAEERAARVRGVLGTLKPRDAQLLLLRSSGLSYRELAETLGIESSSVGTILARAEAEFERRFRARYGESV